MATVVFWPPQLAGADLALAGWPGSNGSVTGTKATVVDGAPVAAAVPAALAVAAALCVALPAVGGALEPPHPASMPITVADTAATASLPLLVLLPPAVTGCQLRD
jgi:hypothetical protein